MVGWIAAWFVALTGSSPKPSGDEHLTVFPTPDIGVNIRTTADASAMRVSGAVRGEPLTVIEADLNAAHGKVGVQDQWLYVQRSNGDRGWVAAWFVSLPSQ